MNRNATSLAYQELQPQDSLTALENLGFRCDGRLLALNSYENRVYQVGIDDSDAIVAKFYRPNRWSDEAILEEHGFARELAAGPGMLRIVGAIYRTLNRAFGRSLPRDFARWRAASEPAGTPEINSNGR